MAGTVASFTGDGAYVQGQVYSSVADRHPDATSIAPPRSTGVHSETADTVPIRRERHLQVIAERGRTDWQKASGYNKRARIEAAIGRYRRVILTVIGIDRHGPIGGCRWL
jgi:hypothetical protein